MLFILLTEGITTTTERPPLSSFSATPSPRRQPPARTFAKHGAKRRRPRRAAASCVSCSLRFATVVTTPEGTATNGRPLLLRSPPPISCPSYSLRLWVYGGPATRA